MQSACAHQLRDNNLSSCSLQRRAVQQTRQLAQAPHIVMLAGCCVQVQLVTAGGLGAGVPTSPTSASHQDVAHGLYSQLSAPDRQTAQTCVTLWPLCMVHNGLPFPVDWRLAEMGSDALQQPSSLRSRGPSFCTQAGESRPLPLVPEGSQLLSIGADTKPGLAPSGSSFCQVLTRPAGASSAALAGHQRRQGHLLMPGSGQSLPVSIQEPGGALLNCTLAARSLADDLPVLQLSLLPQTVVHNCTGMALMLEAPGADPSHIVPKGSTALDWRPLQVSPWPSRHGRMSIGYRLQIEATPHASSLASPCCCRWSRAT